MVRLVYRAAVFVWDFWPFPKQDSKTGEYLRSGHIVFINPFNGGIEGFLPSFYRWGNQGIKEASMARARAHFRTSGFCS